MSFLNNMMNRVAMNRMEHKRQMAALSASCEISNGEFSGAFSCEDTASQCFYSSIQASL